MRYRKVLSVTIDPLTLAAFDKMILTEAHSNRLRSRVIEDLMRSLVTAWQKDAPWRAIAEDLVKQIKRDNCTGDLITPPENRDVPGSLASEILDGT